MNDIDQAISRKILFVDDEILLLEGIKRQFRRDFDISVAEGGHAALALLDSAGPFAVVVSDYNMPGMDGIAFLNAVYQRAPHTILVMLTGRAELDIAVNALHNAHIARFLNKPCPKEILQETLNDGLEQYRLRRSEQALQTRLQVANQQLTQLNEHLESLVADKTRALKLQYRYAAHLAQLASSQDVVETYVTAVAELTGLDNMSLWLSPHQNGRFACFFPEGLTGQSFDSNDLPNPILSHVFQTQRHWHNVDDDTVRDTFFQGRPALCQPLMGKNNILGVLTLCGESRLPEDILAALTGMNDVTATALQSLWHREAFADAQDAIITSLAKLSEYRDPETGSHLLRLKRYSALICNYLGQLEPYHDVVTLTFTEDLVRSSPLHDIGKVGIPDAILKKPGKLTAEEFTVMKTHAQIGGDTLRSVFEQYPSQSFIQCGMEIAYCHHEKWDGSGYPKGLKGQEIPLSARILALVDVYDALTCRRVYKTPFPRDQAKAMIIAGSGQHFDPDLVEAFCTLEAEFFQIAEQFADVT